MVRRSACAAVCAHDNSFSGWFYLLFFLKHKALTGHDVLLLNVSEIDKLSQTHGMESVHLLICHLSKSCASLGQSFCSSVFYNAAANSHFFTDMSSMCVHLCVCVCSTISMQMEDTGCTLQFSVVVSLTLVQVLM